MLGWYKKGKNLTRKKDFYWRKLLN